MNKTKDMYRQALNFSWIALMIMIISDFPEWHVVFDRNQKLLSVYKPNNRNLSR